MLKVLIFDGSKELYSASASSVSLPGKAGEFEILPFHAPMISLLRAGEIRIARLETRALSDAREGVPQGSAFGANLETRASSNAPLETGAASHAGKTLRIRGGFARMENNELTILVER